jgi:hypothetical protein
LRGPVVEGGDAEGPLLVGAGFGNPDPTDGSGPGIQVEGVDQVQALGRLQAGDAVDAGSLLALVVLGDPSDGKQLGVPGTQQEALQGVDGFPVAALGSSVDSSLELVEFPLDLGPGDLLPVLHPRRVLVAHAGLAHGGRPYP